MALSQQDLENLDRTLASGVEEVQDRGRRVRHRSVDDLLKARSVVADEVARAAGRPRVRRILLCAKDG